MKNTIKIKKLSNLISHYIQEIFNLIDFCYKGNYLEKDKKDVLQSNKRKKN